MPDTDPEDIRRWRKKAQELRDCAAAAADETAQTTYRELARKWDARAEYLEGLYADLPAPGAPPDSR